MRGNKSYKANHLITMTLHEFLQIIFPIKEKRGNGDIYATLLAPLLLLLFAGTATQSSKHRKKGKNASSLNQIKKCTMHATFYTHFGNQGQW